LRDDILDEHLNHVGVAESTRFRHFEYERIGALIRDDEREGGISPGAGAWANNGVAALHRPVVSRADSEACGDGGEANQVALGYSARICRTDDESIGNQAISEV